MGAIIPVKVSDSKRLEEKKGDILEEIIWEKGRWIKKSHISLENAPYLMPASLGYSRAFTGLTPHVNEEFISNFIYAVINEQGLEDKANAYSITKRTFGIAEESITISVQIYHI